MKPTTNPPTKELNHWISKASLSPIPLWILLMSLWRVGGAEVGGEKEAKGDQPGVWSTANRYYSDNRVRHKLTLSAGWQAHHSVWHQTTQSLAEGLPDRTFAESSSPDARKPPETDTSGGSSRSRPQHQYPQMSVSPCLSRRWSRHCQGSRPRYWNIDAGPLRTWWWSWEGSHHIRK